MSKLSSAESFREHLSPDEDRLKKAVAEIERISAELRLEDAISTIDRVADDLRKQSTASLCSAVSIGLIRQRTRVLDEWPQPQRDISTRPAQ